jgi:hypothetical protein
MSNVMFKKRCFVFSSVKAQVLIGATLISMSAILLGFSLPVVIGSPCPNFPSLADNCSHEAEGFLSFLGAALAVSEVGLVAASRLEAMMPSRSTSH